MKGTKTSLFLIELMISLLLFAFCAAICIQLFHASNVRTEAANDLAKAVFHATSVAEVYKSVDGDFEKFADYYGADSTGGSLWLNVDTNGDIISKSSMATFSSSSTQPFAAYKVRVDDNGDNSADISVVKGNGFIYLESDAVPDEIFAITVKAI